MGAPARRADPVVLLLRAAALATGSACIVHALGVADHPRTAGLFGGVAAVALVAAVVTLWGWATTAALASIALSYCYGVLRAAEGLDPGAPLMGVGLLLVGEFLESARAGGAGRFTEKEVWRRRLLFLLAVVAGGAATAQFALLVGGAARGTGPVLLFLAAAAAVSALVIVLRLVQSLMRDGAPPAGGR